MYLQPKIDFKPEEVLFYSRKSRSDDPSLDVAEVLAKHEVILDEWSESHLGARVPEENKFREIVSAETIQNRPEIKKVLKLIESPKYKALLIVEVQRLSRGDLEDAGRLMKLLRYTNTIVITPQRAYDINDEYDRDYFERELKRGNEYLEYQKKIMNRGRLIAVQQGDFIGNIPPYGYKKAIIIDGKHKHHTLEPNPEEADNVRMIFDMYVNGNCGTQVIANRLNELGIKPRKSERWSCSAIVSILQNEHYIGMVRWACRKGTTIVENGEIKRTRPKMKRGEYLLCDGLHTPIIDPELFQAAMSKHGRNHRAKAKTKVRNPLAGLVFCQCGKAMVYRTNIREGLERNAPRLMCNNQHYCGNGSCLYDTLIDMIKEILMQSIADFEMKINNGDGESVKLHARLIARLEVKLAELKKKELSQWEKYSEDGMPKPIFEQLNEKVLNEIEEVEKALIMARETSPDPIEYQEKLCQFRDALQAIEDPNVPAEEKNTLLKACIERIDYKREKPMRKQSSGIRKKIKGKSITVNPLPTGASWTETPIEIDVKLKV